MIVTRHSQTLSFLCLALFATSGCAVLSDHNDNIEEAYNAFKAGRFSFAAKEFAEDRDNKLDGLCFLFDRATVFHVAGQYPQSIGEFEAAKRRMGGFDDRAKVNVRDIAETGASFLVNEKTIPYKGEGFERVMLPFFQSKNYFLQGDYEGASVEARRCIFQQKLVRQKYEVELQEARTEARKQKSKAGGVNTNSFFSKVQNECKVDPRYLNSTQSVYELAAVNYLTAVMLANQEDYQNALVFLRRTSELLPQSRLIQRELAYVTQKKGATAEAQELANQFGIQLPAPDSGSVVVFYDSGEAPVKVEKWLVFPTGGFGFQKFALPFYKAIPNPASRVRVVIGTESADTETLTSIEQVAFRYFNDRMPLIVAKAIIRVVAKIVAQKAAELATRNNSKNILVNAAVGLGASAILSYTEQADLRAWRTLPQTLQAQRINLAPGNYPVEIQLIGNSGAVISQKSLGTIDIQPGQTGVLNIRSIDRNFWGSASPNLNPQFNTKPAPKPAQNG